jgi:ABC-2 type transport system permease protein
MSARQAIVLVAWREIRERLRSRVFLVSTLVLLVLVGASTGLNGALSKKPTYRVAVVAPAPAGLGPALRRAAGPFDAKVRLEVVSREAGLERLKAKRVDAVLLLAADRIDFRTDVDPKLAAVADNAVRAVRRHLPPRPELAAVTIEQRDAAASTDAEVLVAMLGASLLLTTIAVYGQWVLTGVVEEKANRVVELVLSTVRPRHLLAGKVIGIGLLGLGQVALVAGLAAALLAAGVFDTPGSLGGSVALVVPWFALGFALYAVAYAAAGAIASRAQDASSAGAPVTYTLLAAFFAGYVVLSVDPNGTVAHLLTVLPLTAPLVLPARSALVGVPLWEHAVTLVAVLATIYGLIRLAGRVYGAGVLRSGARLDLRGALRAARHP